MPLVPGAAEAIRVAQQGLWAVVTSAKRRLAEMLFRVTGLPLPKALITADLIQRGKSDPECYLVAAQELNASPRECIVFEDAFAGVEAGHRAGMPVIGVNTGGDLRRPEMLVHTFRDRNQPRSGWLFFSPKNQLVGLAFLRANNMALQSWLTEQIL